LDQYNQGLIGPGHCDEGPFESQKYCKLKCHCPDDLSCDSCDSSCDSCDDVYNDSQIEAILQRLAVLEAAVAKL
jgi:hypothetical protein